MLAPCLREEFKELLLLQKKRSESAYFHMYAHTQREIFVRAIVTLKNLGVRIRLHSEDSWFLHM